MKNPVSVRARHVGCAGLFVLSAVACSDQNDASVNALPPPGLAGTHAEGASGINRTASPPASAHAIEAGQKTSRAPDEIVLRVNGVALTQAELERAMLHQAAALGIPFRGLPEKVRMRLEAPAYEGLLKRELLRQAAQKDGIVISEAELAAEKARLEKSLPDGRTFEELLQGMMTNEESFLRDLATDLAIARWMKKRNQEAPVIDEGDARKLYEEQKARFASNDKASARHILVAVAPDAGGQVSQAARERANALRVQVNGKDEKTFVEVASEQSDDKATRETGGDLGTFTRNEVLPQIGDAAFELTKGEISEVIRSDRGFHILRGGGVTRGAPRSFEEVKERIMVIAQAEARSKYEASLFLALEQKADIVREIQPADAETTQPGLSNQPPQPHAAQGGAAPHGLPLPSKDNVLPGMRNPHAKPGGELRLDQNGTKGGLKVSPSEFQR